MHSETLKQLLLENLQLCLLRLTAFVVDCVLFAVLFGLAIAPAVGVLGLLALGYLEEFAFLFQLCGSVALAHSIFATAIVFLLFVCYPCCCESSRWQATSGKFLVGLICSDLAGRPLRCSAVVWRLILQALTIIMLTELVCLSQNIYIASWFTTLAHQTVGDFSWFDKQLIFAIYLAPYAVALIMPNGQSLYDLMSARIVTRNKIPIGRLSNFTDSPVMWWQSSQRELCSIISSSSSVTAKRFSYNVMKLFFAVWLLSTGFFMSALVVLPFSMAQANKISARQTTSSNSPLASSLLYRRLDLFFIPIAEYKKFPDRLRLQALRTALALNPRRHSCWYLLAEYHFGRAEYGQALLAIERAVRNYNPQENNIAIATYFGVVQFKNIFEVEFSQSMLFSLRAKIENAVGNIQSACDDYGKAYRLGGSSDDYINWLDMHQNLENQNASKSAVRLAQANVAAKLAYQNLLKHPAEFQNKKNLYNQVINLNNAGVRLLIQKQFDPAISKFMAAVLLSDTLRKSVSSAANVSSAAGEFNSQFKIWSTALGLDRGYDLSLRNLSIAYNGKGQSMSDLQSSFSCFQRALYFDPLNEPAQANYIATFRRLRRDPDSFDDHVTLAKKAQNRHDWVGASIEYARALEIRNDIEVSGALSKIKAEIASVKSAESIRGRIDPLPLVLSH